MKWELIGKMNVRRCTAVATSYKNRIYVIGGYRGEGRCKGIETYNELTDSWSLIPLMLKYPIEASIMTHLSPSEVHLLGGKDQWNETAYSTVYNLEDGLMEELPPLKNNHVLGKGGKYGDRLIVFGGSSNCKLEVTHLPGGKWTEVSSISLYENKLISKMSYSQSY